MRILILVLLSVGISGCAGRRKMIDCPIIGQDPETHETIHSCKRELK